MSTRKPTLRPNPREAWTRCHPFSHDCFPRACIELCTLRCSDCISNHVCGRLIVSPCFLLNCSPNPSHCAVCPDPKQVDLLVFYTPDAMSQVAASTAVQMESIIAAAFASTNEAMANSAIALDVNVVHVQPVSDGAS